MVEKEIFWLDKWDGKCRDGFFIRDDFFKTIERFEKDFGKKVVGIVKPTGWNLELVCGDDAEVLEGEQHE